MFLILPWIFFSFMVAALASRYGRTAGGFFFLSLLISPLFAGILLLVYGKTNKAKARDVLAMRKALAELESK